jgi:hypothetical protein
MSFKNFDEWYQDTLSIRLTNIPKEKVEKVWYARQVEIDFYAKKLFGLHALLLQEIERTKYNKRPFLPYFNEDSQFVIFSKGEEAAYQHIYDHLFDKEKRTE